MPNSLPPTLATWLRRANQHPLRSRLLLSGSTLIAAICAHARVPNDIDYVVTGAYEYEILALMMAEIAAIPDVGNDLRLRQIDEIVEYTEAFPGLRAELVGRDTDKMPRAFLVDLTFGDPLTVPPRAVAVPHVGSVLAVAPESLFAWKVHALVQFGPYCWRPKDIYDLYVLWREGGLNQLVLPEAIDIAFSSRGSTLDELDDFRMDDDWGLSDDGVERWNEFATMSNVELTFPTVRTEIRSVLDQLL